MGNIGFVQNFRRNLNLKSSVKDAAAGLLAGLISLLGGFWLLRGFSTSTSQPWAVQGDLVAEYVNATGLSESGSTQIINGFGWPFQMDKSYFLTTDWISQGILRFLLFFAEPIQAVNLYLVLTFFLIATLTFLAWRTLGFSRLISIVTAIALALLPWHIQRSLVHPNLSLYIAAPLFIIFIVCYLKWQSEKKNSYFYWAVFILIIISISAEYWWIFSFIFLSVFLIYRFTYFKNQDSTNLIGSAILFILIPVSALVSLFYQRSISIYPALGETVVRNFEQVERYSGSFTSLFLPNPLTGIPFLGSLRNNYENRSFLTNLESSPWGSVVTIVSFIIIISIIFLLAFGKKETTISSKLNNDTISSFLIKVFSLLFLVGLGFYWTSGLGSFFGLIFTDWVRSWGRIYIFLVYFAMAASMLLLKQIFSKTFQNKNIKISALISILALIFLDQVINPYPSSASAANDKYQEARSFSEDLSQVIEAGCPILQIPVFPFPEAGYDLNDFQDHEHFWLALADRSRAYSYGANKSTQQYLWQKNLETEDIERLKLQAAAVGYCAIAVDLSAYESRVQEGNRWIKAIGAPIAVSETARWAAWEVGERFTRNQIQDLIALNWVGSFAAGEVQDAIQIDFYEDTFDLFALNPTKEPIKGVVSFEARSGTCTPSQAVTIKEASKDEIISQTDVNKDLKYIEFEINLEPREQKQYRFELASRICTIEWWSETKVAFRDQKFVLAN